MFQKVNGKSYRYLPDWSVTYDSRYEELNFWNTLDADLYNRTLNYPKPIGTILRVLLAILLSNHQEPMPVGNNDHVMNLWRNKPNWFRYMMWRVRNPWEDLRKLYLGFGWAFYKGKLWYIPVIDNEYIRIRLYAPYKAPLFPEIYVFPFRKWEFFIGFKKRGMFSISLRNDGS